MNKNTIIFVLAFVLLINFAYARQYVVDNANVINNPSAVESEIEEFNKETKGIIIIETIDGEDIDPEEMFHEKHKLGTAGNPDLNVLIVFDAKEGKGFVVYSQYHCKLKTAYNGIFNTEEVRQSIKGEKYTEAFLSIVKRIRAEASKNYICPLDRPRQTFECVYGTVEKPKVVERFIDPKEAERPKIKPTAIVLHFTGSFREGPTIDDSIGVLIARDLIVQFMVDKDGTIYQLMKDIDRVASGAKCANRNSIHIEIVGVNEEDVLRNEKQFQSVLNLVSWLSQQYDIDLLQQKASSPQAGLVAHSEVDLECPRATGKFDPGALYMAKARASLCRRNVFFDMTKDPSKTPTREELAQNKLVLDKLSGIKNNAVHLILIDKPANKAELDALTNSVRRPHCELIMQSGGERVSVYSLPQKCSLADEEIKDVEKRALPAIRIAVKNKNYANAAFRVVSETSRKIDESVSESPSIVSGIGDAVGQISVIVSDFLNPTGCAICPTADDYAKQVLSVTTKLSKANIEEAYERAKSKYTQGTDPFSDEDDWKIIPYFDKIKTDITPTRIVAILSERLKTWPYYIMPQVFPKNIKKITEFTNKDFPVYVFGSPKSGSRCSYKVVSNNQVTKEAKITCGEAATITVGPNGDCRHEGVNTCKVFDTADGQNQVIGVFSISFKKESGKIYYFGDALEVFTNGLWNCRIRVESGGEVTMDEKVPCGDAVIVVIGADCILPGVNACKIVVSEGYIFKKYKVQIISVSIREGSLAEYAEVDAKPEQKVGRTIKALYKSVLTASGNKHGVKVSPEEVYTIAVGEGLNNYLFDRYVDKGLGEAVSGYHHAGTDYIGSDIGILKAGGFVSKAFNIEKFACTGEENNPCVSGFYKNLEDAFEGVAGTVAHRKWLFFRDLKRFGVDQSSLTRKQINFWVYYYYNDGPANGTIFLRRYVRNGVLDDKDFINAEKDEIVRNGPDERHNSIIRAVMIETMYNLGALHLPGYSDAYGK